VIAVETNKKFKYIVLFSLITLASAFIIFILILINQFGIFNILSRHENPFVKPKVAILLSDYNFDFYKENKKGYQGIVDQWYNALKEQHIKPVLLRDTDLEAGKNLDADVLVLPSAVCLSDKQISVIKKFVKRGGGLMLNWAAGARRKGGTWRGWDFLEKMANIKIIKMDKKNPVNMTFLTVNSASPVTVGFPSGLRIDLATDSSELLARSDDVDAFYSDWRLYPVITEKGYPPYTAITHSEFGKGKVLWLGFNTNRLLSTRENKFFLRKLVSNSLNWMLGYPQGKIDNWAYGYHAAFFVDQDTEHEHKNTKNLIDAMVAAKVPGTFYCISGIFEGDPQYIKKYVPQDLIEIGSHLDTAQNLSGQSYSKQYKRIKRSQDSLTRLSGGNKVIGLKPAEEVFDNNTIKVLMDLGFTYMIGSPDTPVAVPVIVTLESVPKDVVKLEHLIFPPKGNFVLYPRMAHDDYYIMDEKKILDNDKILAVLKADFHNLYNLGGIYIFAVHTQMFTTDRHKIIYDKFFKYIKDYNLWMLRGKDFASWWSGRHNLEHKITAYDEDKFIIQLTSKNQGKTMKDVGLTYYVGGVPEKLSILDKTTGKALEHKYDPKNKSVNIRIPEVKPQSKMKIEVSLKQG